MERFDVLKIHLEGLKYRVLDKGDEIADRVTFLLDYYKGNIKITEAYRSDSRIYMDCLAFEQLSTMIFEDIIHFLVEENTEGLLVYLQKKYSQNYLFCHIGRREDIGSYASDISDTLASQIIQELIDEDDKDITLSEPVKKQHRADLYREMGFISELDYEKIGKELVYEFEA